MMLVSSWSCGGARKESKRRQQGREIIRLLEQQRSSSVMHVTVPQSYTRKSASEHNAWDGEWSLTAPEKPLVLFEQTSVARARVAQQNSSHQSHSTCCRCGGHGCHGQ